MNRRILYIILGAILLLVLAALLWWWFAAQTPPTPQPSGNFGSSGARSGASGGSQTPTNVGTPLTPVGGSYQIGANTPINDTGGYGGSAFSPPATSTYYNTTPSGVSWIGGPFTPTPINQVNSANPTYPAPSSTGGGGGDNSGLASAASQCLTFITKAAAQQITGALFGTSLGGKFTAVEINNAVQNEQAFLDCIARAVARVALQKMTNSILKWVNSGFNGQPAYVQSFQQLFLSVADQAAGQFIQSSALSFLCTPFKAPVQIAIAQSYARRNAAASSCTLSQALNNTNINGFMNGNFSAGGWKGFLAYTSSPTNNPFGAYLYGQSALQGSVAQAQQYAALDVQNGRGFRSYQEPYNCRAVRDDNGVSQVCDYRTTTPGSVIEAQTNTALGTNYRQLELAKNFDDTLSAFLQILLTSALYNGLSHVNTSNQAQTVSAAGQSLLSDLESAVTTAQQYGYTKQGAIGDLENAQSNLKTLANCYESKHDTGNKQSALDKITSLEGRVTALNNQITTANTAIAALETLMTRTLATHSDAEAAVVKADFDAASAAGSLITAADLTTAQQDRTTLQSEMTTINQDTATKLNQCYASV